MKKEFEDYKKLVKTYGADQAKVIAIRLTVLRAMETLNDLYPPYKKPERCHELQGKLKDCLSIDIKHPYRIIIKPDHDPMPIREEGGLDWSKVTRIQIIDIRDTH